MTMSTSRNLLLENRPVSIQIPQTEPCEAATLRLGASASDTIKPSGSLTNSSHLQIRNRKLKRRSNLFRFICMHLLVASVVCLSAGCSTTPKQKNQPKVMADSWSATRWFRTNVRGLGAQLDNSAGYICYPGIGRYGTGITGGKMGRGVVFDSNNSQVGWAYINMMSAGLQVGVQGYKMLVVFRDDATMQRFLENHLTGNVNATIVALDGGGGVAASFTNGVAIYEGDAVGLMAGTSIGLDYMRYEAVGR